MKLWRVVCAIRGHDFTKWRVIRPTDDWQRHLVAAMAIVDGARPNSWRRCKRCGLEETKPVRTRLAQKVQLRDANAADTTTGKL